MANHTPPHTKLRNLGLVFWQYFLVESMAYRKSMNYVPMAEISDITDQMHDNLDSGCFITLAATQASNTGTDVAAEVDDPMKPLKQVKHRLMTWALLVGPRGMPSPRELNEITTLQRQEFRSHG